MGQALGESLFDIWYLFTALTVGAKMIRVRSDRVVKMAGWMTFLLGGGDAFHLIPRMWALWTTGLTANAPLLGAGKWITSITMTVFYLLLYFIWKTYFKMGKQPMLTGTMILLAVTRIALCFLPQNQWLSVDPPLWPGIMRNVPFLMMGIIIIILFLRSGKITGDPVFRFMPLAITLSFGFYIPVVLFSGIFPIIGVLMIPKTLAYVWIVFMCRNLYLTKTGPSSKS